MLLHSLDRLKYLLMDTNHYDPIKFIFNWGFKTYLHAQVVIVNKIRHNFSSFLRFFCLVIKELIDFIFKVVSSFLGHVIELKSKNITWLSVYFSNYKIGYIKEPYLSIVIFHKLCFHLKNFIFMNFLQIICNFCSYFVA